MPINPIDTEVFVQNLKQAYTILRQNILICNTMVEIINNFNSLNDNDTQLTQSINEIKQHLAEADNQITENADNINKLQTDIDNLDTFTNTIAGELPKKVSVSDTKAILYGNAPTSGSLYNYNVALSEQQLLDDDMSIPTTKWVGGKLANLGVTDTTAYYEYDGVAIVPPTVPTNISQLTGYTEFDFDNLLNCPSKIVCSNKEGGKNYVIYYPIYNKRGSISEICYLGVYFTAVNTINMTILKIQDSGEIKTTSVSLYK